MQNPIERTHLEFLFVAVVLVGSIIFLFSTPESKVKVYDCSIAEISPDYPIEVKNECRKIRAENFNKSLQKPK